MAVDMQIEPQTDLVIYCIFVIMNNMGFITSPSILSFEWSLPIKWALSVVIISNRIASDGPKKGFKKV